MLILISDAFDPGLPGVLKKYGEVTEDKNRVGEANIVLIRSKTKVTKEYIDGAPKLKMVIRGGVGLDNVDREYAKQKGIQVFNTAAASSIAVAEMAMALMLALPNHIPRGDKSMHEGQWLKKELKRTELFGKTLGILGIGRIGSAVAEGIARQPEAAGSTQTAGLILAVLIEGVALFALVIELLFKLLA